MQTSLGIIEGFYGRLYTKDERKELMSFVRKNDYSYYIYAPKNDKSLRRKWDVPFTSEEILNLKEMSDYCSQLNLDFGVGISPLGITKKPLELTKALFSKIDSLIKNTNLKILSILFDDISLYTNEEGVAQNTIIKEVFEYLNRYYPQKKIRLIFCPTYYTFDPILDKVFGTRPEHYYEDICKDLDKSIEIFWTGNKVLSKSVLPEDIKKANELWGRKVTLWDNYPVNDGKFISKHIYTREFKDRYGLDDLLLSHAVNPMLECKLNEVSLETLPKAYKGISASEIEEQRIEKLKELLPNSYKNIKDFLDILNDDGLDALSIEKINILSSELAKDNTKAALEIQKFLKGEYKFDPSCLTD